MSLLVILIVVAGVVLIGLFLLVLFLVLPKSKKRSAVEAPVGTAPNTNPAVDRKEVLEKLASKEISKEEAEKQLSG